MISVNVQVRGLDQIRANFQKAPALTLKYLAKATQASILEVQKKADDSGDSKLFKFKTPRSKRTGQLAQSFVGMSSIDGLSASIGPRVHYAWNVYVGYRTDPKRKRTIYWGPNKYMDRIAKAAEPAVQKHFQTAVDIIAANLTKM